MLRVGGTYYAYGTNGDGKEVQTLTSTDLVHWRARGDALPEVGPWAYPGKTWAPEVLARGDGSFVLYYTANAGGQCVGRAIADDPAGPFVDRWEEPLVCRRDEGGSIDASPFRDEDGWEGGVVEAPTMWRQDGRYLLFYSGEAYDGDLYAVGYATCDGPLGPCVDAPENPILKTACRARGPGHQAVVRDRAGDTWLVYHAWDASFERRQLWLDRMHWEDGRPVVAGPTCGEQPGPR